LQQIIATDPLTDGLNRLFMDGYEATRRIEADPALRLISIFAATSYALSGGEQKARAAGRPGFRNRHPAESGKSPSRAVELSRP
jgi:CheY-like chemotaxis protein